LELKSPDTTGTLVARLLTVSPAWRSVAKSKDSWLSLWLLAEFVKDAPQPHEILMSSAHGDAVDMRHDA
jgi:hypothetical protein